MGRVVHLFLSYCKSHIYELHAVLAATITFFLMFPIKAPIKRKLADYVERRAAEDEKWNENKKLYRKRCNMVVLFLAVLLAAFIFLLVSMISPLIDFSAYTALLSGALTLTEYAVFDQVVGKRGQEE